MKSEKTVQRVILEAMKNWSMLDADSNRQFYTSSDKAVFFDFTPMQYLGWKTYISEIKKVQKSIKRFKIALNDDLQIHVQGHFGYAHCTWKMDFLFIDGTRQKLKGRLTEVLEKRKGNWVIVHEHASIPTPHATT